MRDRQEGAVVALERRGRWVESRVRSVGINKRVCQWNERQSKEQGGDEGGRTPRAQRPVDGENKDEDEQWREAKQTSTLVAERSRARRFTRRYVTRVKDLGAAGSRLRGWMVLE